MTPAVPQVARRGKLELEGLTRDALELQRLVESTLRVLSPGVQSFMRKLKLEDSKSGLKRLKPTGRRIGECIHHTKESLPQFLRLTVWLGAS